MVVSILLLLAVNFAHIQCNSTEIPASTGISPTMVSSLSSGVSFPMSTNELTGTNTLSRSSPAMSISSTHDTTTIPTNPSTFVTSPNTHVTSGISSAYVTSPNTQGTSGSSFTYATSAVVTSQPTIKNYYITYKFMVDSSSALRMGNITDQTILDGVGKIIRSLFNNLTSFNVTVIRIEIKRQAKVIIYDMSTYNQLKIINSDCNEACIRNAASSSTHSQNFTLLSENNTQIVVFPITADFSFTGTSETITTTPTPMNYQRGESPPGTAARLGMGLGITFIALLLIAEVVFLYRKYGLSPPMRQTQYEAPSYHRGLSD